MITFYLVRNSIAYSGSYSLTNYIPKQHARGCISDCWWFYPDNFNCGFGIELNKEDVAKLLNAFDLEETPYLSCMNLSTGEITLLADAPELV